MPRQKLRKSQLFSNSKLCVTYSVVATAMNKAWWGTRCGYINVMLIFHAINIEVVNFIASHVHFLKTCVHGNGSTT